MAIPAPQRMIYRKPKSTTLKFFTLGINSYLLYLLLRYQFFLYLSIFFGISTLAFIFGEVINYRQRNKGRFNQSLHIIDLIQLAKKYIKVNKIFLVASILGLILATLVISQTALLSASYEQRSFDDFSKTADLTGFIFTGVDGVTNSTIEQWIKFVPSFENILQKNNLQMDYLDTVINQFVNLITSDVFSDGDGKYINTVQIELIEYTESIHKFYSQFTSVDFDYNASETILLIPTYFENKGIAYDQEASDPYQFNSTAEFLIGSNYIDSNNSFEKTNTSLDRKLTISKEESEKYLQEHNWNGWEKFNFRLFTSKSVINKILKSYLDYESENNTEQSGRYLKFTSNVYLDLPNLADMDVDTLVKQLQKTERQIWNWKDDFTNKYGIWVNSNSPLLESLSLYVRRVKNLNSSLLFVTMPLIALALFLVYFSLNLVEQRKQRIMAIMKMRGSSKDQLRILLVEEVMVSGIISIVMGMILSIPWTSYALQSVGLFSTAIDLSIVIIPNDWYWKLPLIGIILSLDLNLPGINRLIKTTVDDAEIFEEKKQPFWQKIYLDLILFGLSVTFWIGIRFITLDDVGFYIFSIILLSPFMLLIFFMGAPLVTARYFSSVIDWFSELVWRSQGGLVALSTRNMKKNKFSSSRLVSFLLLGMMLSYVAIIVPQSFDQWNVDRVNYDLGADIYIDGIDSSNSTIWNSIDLPDIDAYSEVIFSTITAKNTGLNQMQLLGINPNSFADAAYWKSSFGEKSLNELVSLLVDNETLLIQKSTLEYSGLDIGDNYKIDVTGYEGKNAFSLKISDTFTYFPRLVNSIPYEDPETGDIWADEGQLVMNLTAVKSISSNYKTGAYVNVRDSANISKVAEELKILFESNSSISVINYDEQLQTINDNPAISVILSSLRSMLVITIISSIIAVSYFTFITLAERKKEIGVFRSMGMVKNQIFLLLLIESLTLLFVSGLLGGLSGYFISINIFFFFSQMFGAGGINTVPPLSLIVPWKPIGIFTFWMVALTVLSSAIPAQITANKQTGSILRAE